MLVVFAILDCAVIGIGFAIVVKPTKSEATPTISQADADYMLDHQVCEKLRYYTTFRDLMNLLEATKTGTITTDTCNTLLVSASSALDDAKKCAAKTHLPEDFDLREHRQHMLAYLDNSQSMWGQVEALCKTSKQDPQLQQLLDKAGIELGNANSSMDNYLKKHPKDRATVVPNPTTIAVAINQTLAIPTNTPFVFPPTYTPTTTPKTETPTPSNTPLPTDSPTTTPSTKSGTSTRTPRPSPTRTATPGITDDDIAYAQDMSKCAGWYQLISKSSDDYTKATKDGTIRSVELCATIAAIAIVNVDEAFSCTNNSHLPQDKDLWSSRSSYLKGLQSARSAWTLLGFGCSSGTFDSRISIIMEQASTELDNGTKALYRYLDRHPELRK
jgi:hypothetical protein